MDTSTIRLNMGGSSNITLLSNDFIDNYMKDANDVQIKLYLYLLRKEGTGCDTSVSELADYFNYTEKDVERALNYWEKKGVLSVGTATAMGASRENCAPLYKVPGTCDVKYKVPGTVNYTIDILRAFKKSPETSWLITALQQYTGRPVGTDQMSGLLYMYDALKMEPALIDYLMQYSIEQGEDNINYMKDTARYWAERGIHTADDAKSFLNKEKRSSAMESPAEFDAKVANIMYLLGRSGKPAPMELLLINRWLCTYGFDMDMIEEACNRAVAAVDTNRPAYAEGILSSWNEKGIRNMDQVRTADENFRNARFNKNFASRPASSCLSPAPSGSGTFCNIEQQDYDFDHWSSILVNND